MYDTIIIGSGPAGMTAGIYAARREMKALIIGREPGGQVIWASTVENYPGFKQIDNIDLINKWQEHVKGLGVEMKIEEVKEIKPIKGYFEIYTSREKYQAKTVIVTIGLMPRRLAIPGETEFTGRGISYCANCDSPFYRGKTVAVIGGGNSALDAAELLSKIAKQVYLVHRRQEFRAFEALISEVKSRPNIKLLLDSEVTRITGQDKLEKIVVKNIPSGQETELTVDGVFIEVGRIAHTDLVAGLVERNEQGQILIDEKCHTKTSGLFAAGDVTNSPYKQITVAIGQATIATLAAYEYLQLKQGKKTGPIFDRGAHHAAKSE